MYEGAESKGQSKKKSKKKSKKAVPNGNSEVVVANGAGAGGAPFVARNKGVEVNAAPHAATEDEGTFDQIEM